jgi:hypothetical protein
VSPRSPHANWNSRVAVAILIALAASIVVHSATYLGIDLPGACPPLWGLHVVAMIAFGAMILSVRGSSRESPSSSFGLPTLPGWAYMMMAAAFIYTGINFAASMALSGGGSPEIRDGLFVLSDHGRVIRTLTADEYRWQHVYIVRGFSGHWMFFLLLPALYFLYRDRPVPADAP